MFSGLISMWTRPSEWMYCKPWEGREGEGEGGGGEGEGEQGRE